MVAPVLPVALAALRPPNPPPRPPPVDIDVKAVPKPVVPDMLVSQARGRRRELEQNVIGVNGTVDGPHSKQLTVLPPFGQTEHIFLETLLLLIHVDKKAKRYAQQLWSYVNQSRF